MRRLMIRADANAVIASGHVQRCLSIVEAFDKRDVEAVFIFSDEEAEKVIEGKGYRTIVLKNDYRQKDAEVSDILKLIEREKADGILVDSYEITDYYISEIAKRCALAYIATMKEIDFKGNLLINYTQYKKQSYFQQKYGDIARQGFLLQGEKYVPLRREFQKVPMRKKKHIERILITTGASNPDDVVEDILTACIQIEELTNLKYTVVVGKYFGNVDKLEEQKRAYAQVRLEYDVKNMSELMKTHDVAISAGGTTLFEVCACGLPTISIVLADNQLTMTEYFKDRGIIPCAGDVRQDRKQTIANIIKQILYWQSHIEEANIAIEKMQMLVDGMGAERIAAKLLEMMQKS